MITFATTKFENEGTFWPFAPPPTLSSLSLFFLLHFQIMGGVITPLPTPKYASGRIDRFWTIFRRFASRKVHKDRAKLRLKICLVLVCKSGYYNAKCPFWKTSTHHEGFFILTGYIGHFVFKLNEC